MLSGVFSGISICPLRYHSKSLDAKTATVGFHSPSVRGADTISDEKLAGKAYLAGTKAIGKLLGLSARSKEYERFYPRSLLEEALSVILAPTGT